MPVHEVGNQVGARQPPSQFEEGVLQPPTNANLVLAGGRRNDVYAKIYGLDLDRCTEDFVSASPFEPAFGRGAQDLP